MAGEMGLWCAPGFARRPPVRVVNRNRRVYQEIAQLRGNRTFAIWRAGLFLGEAGSREQAAGVREGGPSMSGEAVPDLLRRIVVGVDGTGAAVAPLT